MQLENGFSSHNMETPPSPALDFAAVFEANPTPYLVLTLNFDIVAVNEAYLKATHTKREQLMGRNVFEVFPDNPRDPRANGVRNVRISLERVIREKVTDTVTMQKYDIPVPNSEEFEERFWIPVNSPVFNSSGELTHILQRAEDVTDYVRHESPAQPLHADVYLRTKEVQATNLELKLTKEILEQKVAERTAELTESESRFKQLANSMPQIVWTARPDGSVDWYNDWWYEYTGAERGSHWDDDHSPLHPKDDQPARKRWQHSVKTGQVYEIHYRFRRGHDGQYRWHLGRAIPIRNLSGEIIKWIGTNTDIHDQVQLAEDLKTAKSAAEEANRLKSSFLANMSHEIRTPLTAITGFSQLLREGDFSIEEQDAYLYAIDRNGQQLLRIIDDILDISKVEAGKMTIERIEVPLLEVLNDVGELLALKAKANGINHSVGFVGSVPETVSSDPTRLKQILMNLVNNAVKFTEQGYVEVTMRYLKSEHQISFEVKDTGRGLSPDQIPQLFQPFVQADCSITRHFGGTGLGLTLSRHLARALGGDVYLKESQLGQGSTFVARIDPGQLDGVRFIDSDQPESNRKEPEPSQYSASQGVLRGKRILLVDDAPDNRALIKAYLKETEASLETACDGIEGLELAQSREYDLALMDIQMPGMDGYEVTKRLRAQGYKKPIVALSAHAMKDEINQCHVAGCTMHLAKPVKRADLVKTITKLISSGGKEL